MAVIYLLPYRKFIPFDSEKLYKQEEKKAMENEKKN